MLRKLLEVRNLLLLFRQIREELWNLLLLFRQIREEGNLLLLFRQIRDCAEFIIGAEFIIAI